MACKQLGGGWGTRWQWEVGRRAYRDSESKASGDLTREELSKGSH